MCCLPGIPLQPTTNLVVWKRNYKNTTVNGDFKRIDLVLK